MPQTRSHRNSTLELLRILCMLIIVAAHYSAYGLEQQEISSTANLFFAGSFLLVGKGFVSCFVLISGYFMVESRFTLRKALKVLGQIFFYTVGCALLYCLVLSPGTTMDKHHLIGTLFPIGDSMYWFMTDYMILMLATPLLNAGLARISQSALRNLLILSFFMWSVAPNLLHLKYAFNEPLWFFVLYLFAAYCRKYPPKVPRSAAFHLVLSLFFFGCVLAASLVIVLRRQVNSILALEVECQAFYTLNHPLIVLGSFSLFLAAIRARPFQNRFINLLSGATLGVYLLHENDYMRSYLWLTVFHADQQAGSRWLPLHVVQAAVLVFILGAVIDLVRQATVEKLFLRVVDRVLTPPADSPREGRISAGTARLFHWFGM